MEAIRAFRREDIPQVLDLFRTAFLQTGKTAPAGLETYFDRVFFESPWRDEDLPSFVHLNATGAVIGFVGVQPRPLLLHGRRLRAAVATKLMASPSAGEPLAAVRLLSKVFAGPQDVLLSDLSNDAGRRIWEGLGGATALLYSFQWQRPVRPARHSLAWLRARGVPHVITWGLRPMGSVADALVARLGAGRFRDSFAGYTTEDLALDVLAARVGELCSDRALRPEYDERSLQWLLGVAQQNDPHRVLRRRLVRDARGDVAGWFLYFLEPGGASEVVQLLARKGAADAVLHALLADAWTGGTVMLSGRLEPTMVREMSARHCYFRQVGHWSLAHSKQPDVLQAILTGQAFLSRLEGEW
ncbi:MAG TPA: hypothetical protein VGQ25_04300 [Gemmatimonadales bacterium]|jgi:hypothetical protein|nr:hypothetical protein [Gemmatimonadales bacterium]